MVKPTLEAFADATLAAASNIGLNILEGDLWFFAADGSPLEAFFSKQPYVDTERLRYFDGKYHLQSGQGQTLQEIIAERCPPIPQIVTNVRTDEDARKHGWSSGAEMEERTGQALEIAIGELATSFEYDAVVDWTARGPSAN